MIKYFIVYTNDSRSTIGVLPGEKSDRERCMQFVTKYARNGTYLIASRFIFDDESEAVTYARDLAKNNNLSVDFSYCKSDVSFILD